MADISTAGSPETKVKFWAILAIIILIFAITITLVDMGIKTAIIEESNNLKRFIERQTNGQATARSDESRDNSDPDNDRSVPADVLPFDSARVETGNVRQGDKAYTTTGRSARGRNATRPPKGTA